MRLEVLKWDDRLASGDADLDEAHRELVDLYNRIAWVCENGGDAPVVRERIRTFVLYAGWHFAGEEEYMRRSRYPGFDAHKQDHARLLQDAEDFVTSLGGSLGAGDGAAIARYFRYWLTRHTTDKDQQLKAFMNGRARISPSGG